MTEQNNQKIRQIFSQLAEVAYERELEQHLAKLYQYFQLWQSMEIDNLQLAEKIEKFHDEVANDLDRTYKYMDDHLVVTKALAQGLIDKEEIPPHILQVIYQKGGMV